jgi:hypothetical protein
VPILRAVSQFILVLEFARERLSDSPGHQRELFSRHATYFRSYVLQAYPDVSGHHQLRAMHHLDREWANVKVAWIRSLEMGNFDDAAEWLYLLCLVSFFRARYDEALEFANLALAPAGAGHELSLRYVALTYLAWLQVRCGELESAEQFAVEAQQLQAALPGPGSRRGTTRRRQASHGVSSSERAAWTRSLSRPSPSTFWKTHCGKCQTTTALLRRSTLRPQSVHRTATAGFSRT